MAYRGNWNSLHQKQILPKERRERNTVRRARIGRVKDLIVFHNHSAGFFAHWFSNSDHLSEGNSFWYAVFQVNMHSFRPKAAVAVYAMVVELQQMQKVILCGANKKQQPDLGLNLFSESRQPLPMSSNSGQSAKKHKNSNVQFGFASFSFSCRIRETFFPVTFFWFAGHCS